MRIPRLAPSNIWLCASIAALIVASIAVQVARDRGWQPYQPPSGVMWIRSGPLAERLALSFRNLAADVYWMRAVVYYGGQRLRPEQRNFDQLYPLLELVTSLDPYFRVAYRFGAIFLAEHPPGGAGRPDLAVQLLERGVERDPERWEYLQDAGFVHYWWLRDYQTAAEWFRRAGEVPGAPSWMAPLAATTLAEGGNRASSRKLWTELHDNTEAEWVRTTATHRLRQLDAMDLMDEINAGIDRFQAATGRPPRDLQELAIYQRWPGIPLDPTGVPFVLDPATGRVRLGPASTLFPLPDGTGAEWLRPKP